MWVQQAATRVAQPQLELLEPTTMAELALAPWLCRTSILLWRLASSRCCNDKLISASEHVFFTEKMKAKLKTAYLVVVGITLTPDFFLSLPIAV